MNAQSLKLCRVTGYTHMLLSACHLISQQWTLMCQVRTSMSTIEKSTQIIVQGTVNREQQSLQLVLCDSLDSEKHSLLRFHTIKRKIILMFIPH